MSLYRLHQTSLILKNNVAKFMKGISSNELDAPCNAFVDLSGKVIATFPQVLIGPDELLIMVATSVKEEVIAHIQKYGRLSKTLVDELSLQVYLDCHGDYLPQKGEYVCPYMGFQMLTSAHKYAAEIDEAQFKKWRLDHHIPLHTIDYQNEMLLNISKDQYVSYGKGCFFGQEVLARVHYKAKPPRRLQVVSASDLSPEERAKMTSLFKHAATGEERGFLFVKNKETS